MIVLGVTCSKASFAAFDVSNVQAAGINEIHRTEVVDAQNIMSRRAKRQKSMKTDKTCCTSG